MWIAVNVVLFIAELLIIFSYIRAMVRNGKLKNPIILIACVFAVNFAVHLVPYIYERTVLKISGNTVYDVFECLSGAVRNFVGEVTTPIVVNYGKAFPFFAWIYSIGTLLAMIVAVSTVFSVFSHKIKNNLRLLRTMNSQTCDILVGNIDFSKSYADINSSCVILITEDCDEDTRKDLIDSGYTILTRSFSAGLFSGKLFNAKSEYNIICSCEYESFVEYINIFAEYKKSEKVKKNINLYIELDESKAELTRQEIIDNSGCKDHISLFSKNDIFAQEFTSSHSLAANLPRDFLNDDTSVKDGREIRVIFVGYTPLSREIHRYNLLNNHFVTYSDEYHVFPVKYSIYAPALKDEDLITTGITRNTDALRSKSEEYFPLPELNFEQKHFGYIPQAHNEIESIAEAVLKEKTYTHIYVDTGNVYQNIEFTSSLSKLLHGCDRFKIFVNCKTYFGKSSPEIASYGNIGRVLSRDIIVNKVTHILAKKINESYVRTTTPKPADMSDVEYEDILHEKIIKSWDEMDYFTFRSNICSALGLRTKLNLLGLDIIQNKKCENLNLINERYPYAPNAETFHTFAERSLQNAMRAQEHSRWTTFHLLSDWLPMKKSDIQIKSVENGIAKFSTKNPYLRKHACMTTSRGLADLSRLMARKASEHTGNETDVLTYDYFKNDDMLLITSQHELAEAGYSIVTLYDQNIAES